MQNKINNKYTARLGATLAAVSLMGGVALTGAGCKGANLGNVFTMSKSQEVQIGQQAAADIERENKIVTSGAQYEQLQRVAARIMPLARRDYDVPFTVKLIENKQVNAFALPGGPIYFYTGLLDLASSDDEVASVLGHEATHVVKRHSAKQISDAQAKGLIAQLALGNSSRTVQTLAGIGLQLDQLSYSREAESQSDELGFRYMTQAGYKPEAMASFFRKMGKANGGGGVEFLQSHPVTNKRVEAADKRAKAYQANPGANTVK
ncbi:MAG: M48 family metalloprotease [Armatimonadetes bacterium]|nr:M48 family metalloprotease [Armatimonadota bacterium]